MVVTDHLYRTYPELAEGELTEVRKSVVSPRRWPRWPTSLGLGDDLLLGQGRGASGGREKPSILADALEASSAPSTSTAASRRPRELVLGLLGDASTAPRPRLGGADYKSRLQELAARQFARRPRYEVEADGPDHAKHLLRRP